MVTIMVYSLYQGYNNVTMVTISKVVIVTIRYHGYNIGTMVTIIVQWLQ